MTQKHQSVASVYKGFSDKYSLPSFKKLNNIFEISASLADGKDPKFFLRDLRRCMVEKVSECANFVEDILSPSSNSAALFYEGRSINGKVHEDAVLVLKTLMPFVRRSFLLDILSDDSGESKFITEIFCIWGDIQQAIKRISTSLELSWKEKSKANFEKYIG
ncbi:hypothetical protein J4430_02660 [Candidatus Woesearchaeota archaeon]|nr:hypothetical protein [Candidatus Woesearchaeota archaeon]